MHYYNKLYNKYTTLDKSAIKEVIHQTLSNLFA